MLLTAWTHRNASGIARNFGRGCDEGGLRRGEMDGGEGKRSEDENVSRLSIPFCMQMSDSEKMYFRRNRIIYPTVQWGK